MIPGMVNDGHDADMQLVSVITPCYNAAAFVAETIAAVAVQTYPRIEHIVVDDGSDDGSWEVIERHAACVAGIRLGRNHGGSYARNRGAEIARGEFLMFLDADDLITPDTIEGLVAAARQQPGSIAICDCRRWRQRPDGSWGEAPRERPVPEPGDDLFEAYLTMSAWPPPCSVLWPRNAYEQTGGWDEELARDQDTDILLRAYARGSRLVRAQCGIGYYRLIEGDAISVSSGISLARFRASIRVLDKLTAELVRRGQHHLYTKLLSRAYHKKALFGFRTGCWEDAREALRKGEALGRYVASSRPSARVLERLLGMERKEILVQYLVGLGLTNAGRRDIARRKRISNIDDDSLMRP